MLAVTESRFPRSARLLTAAEYASVFQKSRRFSDRYWTVLLRSDAQGRARLGLAIAKKRAKRAVDRNRIKRVARESFRSHQQELRGCELVIMNRDDTGKVDAATLRMSLDTLMNRLGTSLPKP